MRRLACLHQPLTMRTLATLLLAFLLAPAFAQTPCDGADHTILAGNYYYNPASLTINAGETVAWVNEDGFHDVNGDISVLTGMSFGNPEAFSLPSVSGNAMGVCMGAHTFTVPGTYEYDCSIGSRVRHELPRQSDALVHGGDDAEVETHLGRATVGIVLDEADLAVFRHRDGGDFIVVVQNGAV